MQFTGENLAKGSRVKPGKVVSFKSDARGHHWRHIARQTDLRNQRLRLQESRKWKGDHMQLLLNQPKLNEGRGRKATVSTFNVDPILEATETETLMEAVLRIIELGSPFLAADRSNKDWSGTKAGAEKVLKAIIAEETGNAVGVSRRTKGETKDTIQFSFHLKADTSEEE